MSDEHKISSNNVEYAEALAKWLDCLVLTGNSGRRAVFVERSLKRQYRQNIQNAMLIGNMTEIMKRRLISRQRSNPHSYQIPWNWKGGEEAWQLQVLWNLTMVIAKKFKTEVPEEFVFRKTLLSI